MKTCPACKQTKPTPEFGKNRARRDGLQIYCRPCTKEVQHRWYVKHKEGHSEYVKRRRAEAADEKAELIVEYLKSHCCVDCGEADPVVLEFDHVKGPKRFTIGSCLAPGYSWTAIQREIRKCEVRCANCHRRKTARQFGYRKAVLMNLTRDDV